MGLFSFLSKKKAVQSTTGRVIPAMEIYGLLGFNALLGDESYAEVDLDWLEQFGDDYASTLHAQGVVKWDSRFDCNHFATFYAALAQMRFYREQFQSRLAAQSLAVGEMWYRPTASTGHAVIVAITKNGLTFIEPQTRQKVAITPEQFASRYLIKF
jgi:hypothetical protein